MILSPIFCNPIWYKDNLLNDNHLKELINFSFKFENEYIGNQISNQGGYQSQNIPSEIRKQYLDDLETKFLKCIDECLSSLKSSIKLKIDNIWLNINREGDFNVLHNHPNSYLSGVFYLFSNDINSKLRFFRNNSDSYLYSMLVKDNYVNYDIQTFDPIQNRLIVFPSWFNHDVLPCSKNCTRISIAFNTFKTNDKF